MLKVNIMLYMNHVIHHIETPPGLTPPRLLAGGWEGKVLYVDSQGLTPPRLLPGGREGKVLYVELELERGLGSRHLCLPAEYLVKQEPPGLGHPRK